MDTATENKITFKPQWGIIHKTYRKEGQITTSLCLLFTALYILIQNIAILALAISFIISFLLNALSFYFARKNFAKRHISFDENQLTQSHPKTIEALQSLSYERIKSIRLKSNMILIGARRHILGYYVIPLDGYSDKEQIFDTLVEQVPQQENIRVKTGYNKRLAQCRLLLQFVYKKLSLFILCLLVVALFTNFDIPKQDTSDMLPTRKNIAKEENAYFVYRQAYTKLVDAGTFDEILNNHQTPLEEIEAILASNKEALSLLGKGLSMDFEEPEMRNMVSEIKHLGEWRRLAFLKILQLRLNQQPQDCLKFLAQLQEAPQSSISQLVVNGIQSHLVAELAQQTKPFPTLNFQKLREQSKLAFIYSQKSELKLSVQSFRDFQNLEGGMFEVDETSKQNILKHSLQRSYFFQINRIEKRYYDLVKSYSQNLDTPFIQRDNKVVQSAEDDLEIIWWKELKNGNTIANIMLQMMMPAHTKILKKHYSSQAQLTGLETLLALKKYQKSHNALPISLGKLVPQYLDKIPLDPFDGKSIRYDSERGVLYSIGMNLKDDGGRIQEGQAFHDNKDTDIVFQVLD